SSGSCRAVRSTSSLASWRRRISSGWSWTAASSWHGVHSVVPDRGIRHELEPPDERFIARVARVADQAFGPAAAAAVERGADLLREEVMTRPAPRLSLAHGDWLPKH